MLPNKITANLGLDIAEASAGSFAAAPTAPDVRQAVILAGGRGSRLGSLTDVIPKPMILVNGRPFIAYVVEMLRDAGISRILFLLGYRADVVREYFGDGQQFGIAIDYAVSPVSDETGTRLRHVRERLDPTFLLTYCDNYWPLALPELQAAHRASGCRATLTVYRNTDAYTRDNVRIANGRIVDYDKGRTRPGLAGVDIGYGLFDRSVMDEIPHSDNPSFEATVYPRLVQRGTLGAYQTDHRYYSIGSAERLPLTTTFLNRRKTVLLDRDGTLNVCMPRAQYVTHWGQWRWIPGTLSALAHLTAAGYRLIVITNQPGIARGAMTAADLDAVHRNMIAEAAGAGARIDAVLACTHGWDDGCACRKPLPGLLFEAQRRFSLDLTRTPFIGDDDRDGAAAERAGAPFHRVTDEQSLTDIVDELLGGQHTPASLGGERSFQNAS